MRKKRTSIWMESTGSFKKLDVGGWVMDVW